MIIALVSEEHEVAQESSMGLPCIDHNIKIIDKTGMSREEALGKVLRNQKTTLWEVIPRLHHCSSVLQLHSPPETYEYLT